MLRHVLAPPVLINVLHPGDRVLWLRGPEPLTATVTAVHREDATVDLRFDGGGERGRIPAIECEPTARLLPGSSRSGGIQTPGIKSEEGMGRF